MRHQGWILIQYSGSHCLRVRLPRSSRILLLRGVAGGSLRPYGRPPPPPPLPPFTLGNRIPPPPSPLPPFTLGSNRSVRLVDTSDNSPAASRNPQIALNHEIIKLGKLRDWEGLLDLAVRSGAFFNHVNCSTLLSQLGRHNNPWHKTDFQKDPRLDWFLNALASTLELKGTAALDWMPPREAANMVHALAKLQLCRARTSSSTFLGSAAAAEYLAGDPHRRHSNNHNNHHPTRRILDWISHPPTAARFVQTASLPQAIAIVIWSCAHLQHFSAARQLLQALEDPQQQPPPNNVHNVFLRAFVQHGQPQDFSNTLYAAARCGYPARNLWNTIESMECAESSNTTTSTTTTTKTTTAQRIVYHGTPQAVSNTAWSCATLALDPPQFLQAVEQRAGWLLQNGSTQQVANTVWACASLGYAVPQLISAVQERAEWMCTQGTPQAIANTVHAYAILGLHHPHHHHHSPTTLYDPPVDADRRHVKGAEHDHDPFAIFAAVERHVDQLVPKANVQVVVNTCYALAISGWVVEQQRRQQQHQQHRSTSAGVPAPAAQILWKRAIELFQSGQHFHDEELRQLAQAQILWKAQHQHDDDDDHPPLIAPPAMAQRLEHVLWNLYGNQQSEESLHISETLRTIGFEHEAEVDPDAIDTSSSTSSTTTTTRTANKMMMAIDFANVQQKLAVEVDGPSHFLKQVGTGSLTTLRNGPTMAKRDHLQRLGWTVVSLDYRDCNAAREAGTLSQFLQQKLEHTAAAAGDIKKY